MKRRVRGRQKIQLNQKKKKTVGASQEKGKKTSYSSEKPKDKDRSLGKSDLECLEF